MQKIQFYAEPHTFDYVEFETFEDFWRILKKYGWRKSLAKTPKIFRGKHRGYFWQWDFWPEGEEFTTYANRETIYTRW